MGKFKYLLALVLCAVCAISLMGCKDNNKGGGNGGGEEVPSTPKYSITTESNSQYTLSLNKTSAKESEEIIITAKSNNIDKRVASVQYNEETATKNFNGTFSFSMPAKDVRVSAILEDYVEILASDDSEKPFVSFDKSNTKVIVPNSGKINLYAPINATNMGYLGKSYSSSNENAIPKNAISIEGRITSSSFDIIGADISIDTSKVKKGYSWIEINFRNAYKQSEKGKIVFKITVDDKIEVETWTETLIFDTTNILKYHPEYENSDFYIGISDYDYVSGMTCKSYQFFENLKIKDNKIIITIEYAVGHEYSVTFKIQGNNDVIFNITSPTIGDGNDATGYNQYVKGKLSFAIKNSSLTLPVVWENWFSFKNLCTNYLINKILKIH